MTVNLPRLGWGSPSKPTTRDYLLFGPTLAGQGASRAWNELRGGGGVFHPHIQIVPQVRFITTNNTMTSYGATVI